MSMVNRVEDAFRRRNLLPETGPLLVGVSGGADSLALLHVLAGLRGRLGLRLHVVTIEHGVRGQASVEDAEFVARMGREWDVPVEIMPVRAKLRAGSSAGIEAALRSLRYHAFARVAEKVGATTVAVAHHADDQAETVLMHLVRGSGLRGLGGMPWRGPMPGHPALTLVRPLLGVTRAEIESYCAGHGLQPRIDATNEDMRYFRNRLRHDVLPFLRDLNPQIDRNLRQLADIASVENDYMETHLARVAAQAELAEGRVRLPRPVFVGLHLALRRRFIVWAAGQIGSVDDLTYALIDAAVDLALHGEQGALALLSGGMQLRRDYEAVVIERQGVPDALPDAPLLEAGETLSLRVGRVHRLRDGWALELSDAPFSTESVMNILPGATLTLRARRSGDRFLPQGLNGHSQKLSRWMINRKIPEAIRDRIPLLDVDGEIAAISVSSRWVVAEPYLSIHVDRRPVSVRWLR